MRALPSPARPLGISSARNSVRLLKSGANRRNFALPPFELPMRDEHPTLPTPAAMRLERAKSFARQDLTDAPSLCSVLFIKRPGRGNMQPGRAADPLPFRSAVDPFQKRRVEPHIDGHFPSLLLDDRRWCGSLHTCSGDEGCSLLFRASRHYGVGILIAIVHLLCIHGIHNG
jgi:hypothetical protein